MAEECEQAAVEACVRREPLSCFGAYRAGRYAAIDELRRLTQRRRRRPLTHVSWPVDDDGCALDFPEEDGGVLERVDDRQTLTAWASKRSVNTQRAVALVLSGLTFEQAAAEIGVSPSRLSQYWRSGPA
jgi:DNA-directed RNA polymerase specialized sigma24 family protein